MTKPIIVVVLLLIFFFNGSAQSNIQNIKGRDQMSLNGRWNYIIDPYQMGYLDYRQEPYDITKVEKSKLVEYNFDYEPSLKVPGDWNSQSGKLEFYEGTLWYRREFQLGPEKDKRYFQRSLQCPK